SRRYRLTIGVVCALGVLGVSLLVLTRHWRLTRKALVQALQEGSGTRVEIGAFHTDSFPYTRAVAESLVFRRQDRPDLPPLMTIQRLTIQSDFTGLLARRVARVRAEGVYVHLSSLKSRPQIGSNGATMLKQLLLDRAVVEFERRPPKAPLRFEIHQSRFD